MNKIVSISLITLTLASCATQPTYVPLSQRETVSIYQHESLGEITSNDQVFKDALTVCKQDVYSKGINVNGELVTDTEKLNNIFSEYLKSQPKNYNLKKGIPSTEDIINRIAKVNPDDPSHINDIRRARTEVAECREKSFKLIRIDSYHKETGELIRSTPITEK